MNPTDYGTVLAHSIIGGVSRYIIINSIKRIFQIDASLDQMINNVTLLGPSDLKWIDTKLDEGFKREIGKSTLYFLDGEIVLQKLQLNAKSFRRFRSGKRYNQ